MSETPSPVRTYSEDLDIVTTTFNALQMVATACIAVVGLVHTQRARKQAARAERRSLVESACASIDVEFAVDLFLNGTFRDARSGHELSALAHGGVDEWGKLFYLHHRQASTAHRAKETAQARILQA